MGKFKSHITDMTGDDLLKLYQYWFMEVATKEERNGTKEDKEIGFMFWLQAHEAWEDTVLMMEKEYAEQDTPDKPITLH